MKNLKKFSSIPGVSRTHLKNIFSRDTGSFPRVRGFDDEGVAIATPRRRDEGIAGMSRIPKGFGHFPAPPRCIFVGVPIGTLSSMHLAESGKWLKTRLEYIFEMGSNTAIAAIRLYQTTFSPDHGIFNGIFGFARCRFYPSCSEYTLRAQRQYGLLKGSVVSLKRILRCGPWSGGGYDPV